MAYIRKDGTIKPSKARRRKYVELIKAIQNMELPNVALLVVDAQKDFAKKSYNGNDNTEAAAEKIQKLVPEFRKHSIPVYAIYINDGFGNPNFYKFAPEENDVIVAKSACSAFKATSINLNKDLKEKKIKHLLVCGFNESACVNATGKGGVENDFNVFIMQDLSANDSINQRHLDAAIERGLNVPLTALGRTLKIGATSTTATKILRDINNPSFAA